MRCTHEHITFGARTSARCEWVFRCGSFFGKCRGNANGTTLTIQRTVYAVCETLMFFYFLFLCVVFFFLCRSRAWARLQAQNASPQSTQFGKSQRNACIAWIYVYRRSRWRGGVLGVSMAIGKSWWCLYDCYTNGSDNISTVHTQCILPWTSPSSIDPG